MLEILKVAAILILWLVQEHNMKIAASHRSVENDASSHLWRKSQQLFYYDESF